MGNVEREAFAPTKETTHPLKDRLWQGVLEATLEKDYTPDRERQKKVFDRINWESFQDEIRNDKANGKQLRGKLFEMLIQADPLFGERTPLEKELLALAHNPDAFGLGKELGHHRNPDMAFLILEKIEGAELIGVGESKLGLLNERSFKQLSETGFAKGAEALIHVVNTLEDPEKHGLKEIAKARPLRISPEFSQLLVVPANRNIEWKSTLINRKEFSKEGRDKFYVLLSDTRHLRTARAAFSTAEVVGMTKVI
ncbi:MAG: hypothetical protein AAB492_02350 [Patescibacteria group bacterium]